MVIRKALRWAAHPDRGLCAETPFGRIEMLREDRRVAAPLIPSPSEVRQVVRWLHAHGHEREPLRRGSKTPALLRKRIDKGHDPRPEARLAALYVAVSLATGARISEIIGCTAAQIHPGAWIVPPGKGHAERRVPLGGDTERALRELVAANGHIKSRNGRVVRINERWALDLLIVACAGANLPRIRPHDLRRTYATEARRADVPLPVIRDLMGHKDTATTERYIGRYREDLAISVPVPDAISDLFS